MPSDSIGVGISGVSINSIERLIESLTDCINGVDEKDCADGRTLSEMCSTDETEVGTWIDMRAVRILLQYMVIGTIHIINLAILGITFFTDFKDTTLAMSLTKGGTLFISHGYKYNGCVLNIILKCVK